ncbi:Zn-dependent hydrolase [Candidatus Puniceispirillum marinum]|uniref:N-carbamoyl-L-amino acid amidohydrolase n=1 Tax=Puniceispirillum marinum (strain IMCC1322) TaxID=488538 RepID=D5BRE3_PUNMI|nr:Zn-dependent hydrolase [Candidatus Puniceispirillum marinum]ADE38840.1 N-carbamoyl-L-amino acid amidohydrolase [Candidatus Puniceispirillum marinum IMCC1322]
MTETNISALDMRGKNLRINSDRLWDSLMDMAKIGPGVAGGNNRQTLTDEDAEGRRVFQQWCEAEGMTMGLDKLGNMFAHRDGTDPTLPPVMIGSHLDTQPTGGKYDGVLGVLAGLEIIRTLNDTGIKTKHPIEVVNWTNEEGARFSPPMMSSSVFAGMYSTEWVYDREDADGKTVGDELARIGWLGDEDVGARKMAAFFELHIEQGPILEDENIDVGVVTHGQGLKWLQVTLTGKSSHTGSTPMKNRVNAGLGMARITQLVDEIAWSHAPLAVGAVGHCDVYPNSRNIIPGKVVFTIDFRHPTQEVIDDMEQRFRKGAQVIIDEIGLTMEIEQVGQFDPVTFDEGCVSAVRRAAERLGYAHRDIVSGAGHDACLINRVAPTAMVMCPCVDGLSHNEAEEISKEWAAAGTDVLFHAVLETAGIVDD